MYVGRFVVVAPGIGGYRVSSRSFPHRRTVDRDDRVAVEPTEAAPPTDNPYVSYNCARAVVGHRGSQADGSTGGATGPEPLAVLGNGSHVDPIAEKLGLGLPPRDALVGPLLALDYEKDDYDTPRVAGIVAPEAAWIGTVRRDALLVESVDEPTLVATYERDAPEAVDFAAATAADAAAEIYGFDFEHPICAAGAAVDADGVEFAVQPGDEPA